MDGRKLRRLRKLELTEEELHRRTVEELRLFKEALERMAKEPIVSPDRPPPELDSNSDWG